MKRAIVMVPALLAMLGLLLGSAFAGEEGKKVLSVGKDGLKVEGKIAENEKRYEYKITLEGKDLELKLRAIRYQVKLEADMKYTLTIDTTDADFDPLLVVQDDKGKILAYDDDSGGNFNSKLEFTPKASGVFTIHAAGLRDTLGPYTLRIVAAKSG